MARDRAWPSSSKSRKMATDRAGGHDPESILSTFHLPSDRSLVGKRYSCRSWESQAVSFTTQAPTPVWLADEAASPPTRPESPAPATPATGGFGDDELKPKPGRCCGLACSLHRRSGRRLAGQHERADRFMRPLDHTHTHDTPCTGRRSGPVRHERTCHVTPHRSATGPRAPVILGHGHVGPWLRPTRAAEAGRPATGCRWPLTGRLPSTTARPTGRQADE